MDTANTRRQFLRISALAGSGLALTACRKQVAQDKTKETKDEDEEGWVESRLAIFTGRVALKPQCWAMTQFIRPLDRRGTSASFWA